jgi:hypothetical protein
MAKKGGHPSLFFAGTEKVVVHARVDDMKPGERLTARWHEIFEEAFLKKTNAKKLAATQPVFRGIPSYQWDVVMPSGQAYSVRVLYANNKFYELHIVSTSGPFPAGVDLEPIFQGFNFTNQPQPVVMKETEVSERARAVGGAATIFLVGAIVGLALYYDHWKKQRKKAALEKPSP